MSDKDLRNFGTGEQSKFLTTPVLKHIRRCSSYVYGLSEFNQYIIWRYTLGSASINYYMITGKLSENAVFWTQQFINFLVNSRIKNIPFSWSNLLPYLRDKITFENLTPTTQAKVAEILIKKYIADLTEIIENSPRIDEAFHVYKVSSRYAQVPDYNDAVKLQGNTIVVEQMPFNSTSLDASMNFSLFLAPDAQCCLWDITLPVGSNALYIPSDNHGYPFEHEVILLPCNLEVFGAHMSVLSGVPDLNIVPIQDRNNISMGAVYMIDEVKPCKSPAGCIVSKKMMETYDCIMINI
jgi:hypothetical protein